MTRAVVLALIVVGGLTAITYTIVALDTLLGRDRNKKR